MFSVAMHLQSLDQVDLKENIMQARFIFEGHIQKSIHLW